MARDTGLFIGGAVCLGAGLFGVLVQSGNHRACNSGLGTLGQVVDQNLAHDCALNNAVWLLGIFGIVVGAALLIGGFITRSHAHTQGPSAPPPMSYPPGWYPDTSTPSVLRWWDGYQWTPTTRPRDG